jgi:hypothetical protein
MAWAISIACSSSRSVGEEFQASHPEELDQIFMRALCHYAYDKAAESYPWKHAPPGSFGTKNCGRPTETTGVASSRVFLALEMDLEVEAVDALAFHQLRFHLRVAHRRQQGVAGAAPKQDHWSKPYPL